MELKTCPFCGGEPELRYTNDNHRKPFVACKFGCFNVPPCPLGHIVTWDYKTEAEAIEAWNRRLEPVDIPMEYFEAGGI